MLGWIGVKPDGVMQLLDEVGTAARDAVASHESARCAAPSLGWCGLAIGCGPVRGLDWWIGLRENQHARSNIHSERRNERRACLVAQQPLPAT